jgi:glutamyl-tRNA synthetase
VIDWAETYDPDLVKLLVPERKLALRVLAVERDGVDNPRKDLRKWSDFRLAYGFFFPECWAALKMST